MSRLAGKTGSKEAGAAWARLTTIIGIPALALALINQSDEYKEDYEAIPEQERRNYFMIPRDKFFFTEDGERVRDYWRIPKREMVKLFGNLIESSVEFAREKTPDALRQYAISFLEDTSPVNIEGRRD